MSTDQPKIFISFSQLRARKVALALEVLIKEVLIHVHPVVSEKDFRAGQKWEEELNKALRAAHFGILCITSENGDAPWISYEAGMLASPRGHLQVVNVAPLLIDTQTTSPTPIPAPLLQFHAVYATQDTVRKLLCTDIPQALGAILGENVDIGLRPSKFAEQWPVFEGKLQEAIDDDTEERRILTAAARIRNNLAHFEAKQSDLFTHIVSWSLSRLASQGTEWRLRKMTVRGDEALAKGIEVFKNLEKGGFATLRVKNLEHFWSSNGEYFESCRRKTRELIRKAQKEVGRQVPSPVVRVFIIDDHTFLFNDSLRRHIKEDDEAGIDVRICFADSRRLSLAAAKDFGLWDDQLLCEMIETVDCHFTSDPDELKDARLWMNEILSSALPDAKALIDKLKPDPRIDEVGYTAKMADEMRLVADDKCGKKDKHHYVSEGQSCHWYHAAWEYLRFLNMVSSPDWHAKFYSDAFAETFKARTPSRVLISGAADHSMLHHVVRAALKHQADVTIDLIDLCDTPISICDRYQDSFPDGYTYHSYKRSILEHNELNSYDLITTDAFLSRFTPGQQLQVTQRWHKLLKPNGRVVTTVRKGITEGPVSASTADVWKFVGRAVSLINTPSAPQYILKAKSQIIEDLVENYARQITSHPMKSEADIFGRFVGFNCIIETEKTYGEFEPTEYFRIIATKKELSKPDEGQAHP